MTRYSDGPLLRTRTGYDRLPEDGEVRRFFDPRFNAISVMVLPGRHYVTAHAGEMVVTLLGSCVAACIRDPDAGVGGLNHFLLPESESGDWGHSNAAMRYGNHAMEVLINDILKRGGQRQRLEVKLFGGAHVVDTDPAKSVGSRNIAFIHKYLADEGLEVAAEHLGGSVGRRIHYFPVSGRARMLLLRRKKDSDVFSREREIAERIRVRSDDGDIELFE